MQKSTYGIRGWRIYLICKHLATPFKTLKAVYIQKKQKVGFLSSWAA
jgi:hypothetical protein